MSSSAQPSCRFCIRVIGLFWLFATIATNESPAAAPFAHTQQAIPNLTTNAILGGMVSPNGEATTAWFEWSKDGNYNLVTVPTNIGSGISVIRVSSTIMGLGNEGSCRFRLVASNASGVIYGTEQRFKATRKILAWGGEWTDYDQTIFPPDLTNAVAVDSGNYHCLALRANGKLVGWGANYANQINVPASISNVVAIASAQDHNIVLQENGIVRGFGNNSYGVRTPPAGLSNAIGIATGGYHSLALKPDGTIVRWGLDSSLYTSVTDYLSNVVAFAAGGSHDLALLADGTVVAWGNNLYGQTNVPLGLTNVIDVAAGNDHSAALKSDGTVILWGAWTNTTSALTNIISIAGGEGRLALRAGGTVIEWNSSGVIAVKAGITNATAVAAGWLTSLVLGSNTPPASSNLITSGAANNPLVVKLAGSDPENDSLRFTILTLPAAGLLHQYQSGSVGPSITTTNTPVSDESGRVWFVPAADSVGAPYGSFTVQATDGEFDSGQATAIINIVGQPYTHTQPAAPVSNNSAQLNGMVSANGFPTTAWFEWGMNQSYGQITAPTPIGVSANVTRVSHPLSGLFPTEAIYYRLVASNQIGVIHGKQERCTTGQKVTVWGPNNYGQLIVPADLTNAVALAGVSHRLVLKSDATVVAWGQNNYSQINVPASATNVIAVANGDEHSLALRADSTVVGWGRFSAGQIFPPAGLSNVIAIAGGNNHSLALRNDGTVVAWGYADYGQINVPPSLSNVVAIAGGFLNSLALKADGTVLGWGYQSNSLVPPGLSNVVAIRSVLALKSDGTVTRLGSGTSPPAGLSNVVAITDFSALKSDGTIVSWSSTPPPVGLSNIIALESTSAIGPNQPPVATPQNIINAANDDILIRLASTDANGDPLSHRIVTLPSSGNLFQCVAGGRGLPITTTNIVVSDPQQRIIFAPGTNELGNPYAQFLFLASDGTADSSPAIINVTIIGSPSAATLPPVVIEKTSVNFVGMVLPNGFPTTAWFEWGTNMTFTEKTPLIQLPPGSSVVTVGSTLSNLTFGKVYWARIIASNTTGMAYGDFKPWTSRAILTSWGSTNPNFPGPLPTPANATNVTTIAAGPLHSLARRLDGTVVAWGNSSFNKTIVPTGLSNVIRVAAGGHGSIALKQDRTVVSWGSVGSAPTSVTNVVAVCVQNDYGVALLANGTIKSWQSGFVRSVPSSLTNIIAIEHTLALRADGTVVSWASGTTNFTVINNLSNVIALAAGDTFFLALKSDGKVFAWGSGSSTNVPASLSNVIAIAAGGSYCLALHSDGSLSKWGGYGDGLSAIPPEVTNVVAVASGQALARNLALRADLSVVTSSATCTGYVNTDLPLALPAYSPQGHPLALRLRSLPSVGSVFQFAAGNRGAQITDTNTLITDAAGWIIFAPASNSTGTPYSSFGFTSADATSNSPSAIITVNIVLPPAPQMSASNSGWTLPPSPRLLAATTGLSAANFTFAFDGHPNLAYSVWASTNLTDWELLGPATSSGGNQLGFFDPNATNFPRRFYRISTPATQGYSVNFTGASNASYRVWASTNLIHWQVLGPASPTSNGWFNFTDFDAVQWSQRFYKAGAP